MDLGGRRDEVQGHWASLRQRQHPDQFHPGPGQLGHHRLALAHREPR